MGANYSFFDDDDYEDNYFISPLNFQPYDIIHSNQIELYPQFSSLILKDLIDILAKAISLLRFTDNFKTNQPGHLTQFKILVYQPIRAKVLKDYQNVLLAFVKMYTNGALIGIESCSIESQDSYVQTMQVTFIENFNYVYFLGARIATEINALTGVNVEQLSGIIMGLLSSNQTDQFIAVHFDNRILSWDICFKVFELLPQISHSIRQIYGRNMNCIVQRYVEQYNYFVLFQYENIDFQVIQEIAQPNLQILMRDIKTQVSVTPLPIKIPEDTKFYPSSLPFIESFINSDLIKNDSEYLIKIFDSNYIGVSVVDMRIQFVRDVDSEGVRIKDMVSKLTTFFMDQKKVANLAQNDINFMEIIPPIFDYQGEDSKNDEKSENSALDASFDENEQLIDKREKSKTTKRRKIKYNSEMASIDIPLTLLSNNDFKQKLANNVTTEDQRSGLSIDLKTWQKNSLDKPTLKPLKTNLIPPLDKFVNEILFEFGSSRQFKIDYLNSFKYPKIQKYLKDQNKQDAYITGICKELVKHTSKSVFHDKENHQIVVE